MLVPDAVTVSVAFVPMTIVWLAGLVAIEGAVHVGAPMTVTETVLLAVLPHALLTFTQ